MFIDKDRDGNYECCVFLGFFYKRNYLKIKLLLLLIIIRDKASQLIIY